MTWWALWLTKILLFGNRGPMDQADAVGGAAGGDLEDQAPAPAAGEPPAPVFSTLVMAVSLLVYSPPHGVLFEHHVLAYYIALAFIFAAGVVEVWAAFWAAEGEDQHGHRRALGMAVLWVSVIPLAGAFGLGGYAVLVKA